MAQAVAPQAIADINGLLAEVLLAQAAEVREAGCR